MSGPTTSTETALRPATGVHGRSRDREATAALVALWGVLEAMPEDEARRWLSGPASAFLLGLDVSAVLDALVRDRARRAARGGAS